jgi:hypothetical protein
MMLNTERHCFPFLPSVNALSNQGEPCNIANIELQEAHRFFSFTIRKGSRSQVMAPFTLAAQK